MNEYDVLIIGTGTAGQTAAALLAEADLSVAMADKREYGGTCALRGCQPKKYLVTPAHAALEGKGLTARGFQTAPELNWRLIQKSRNKFTSAIPEGTEKSLESMAVQTLHGECTFIDSQTVRCGVDEIKAKRFLIASGSEPVPLPFPGGEHALNSDDFLYLPELPENIVFIGGGYVSMEFAFVASAAGSKVTVIQRGNRVLDRFDPDLVDELCKGCTDLAMDVITGAEITSITVPDSGGYDVNLSSPRTVHADIVVGAIGRRPDIAGLGLDKAGVKYGRKGIETNGYMQSSVSSIYAAGDSAAGIMLAPVSDAEARIAARNIIMDLAGEIESGPAGKRPAVDFSLLPTVVFTYPQLAQFGINETEAVERGGIRINRGSGAGWPTYRRLNEGHVRYKVMIEEKTGCILGAHILSPHAGELINLLALAAKTGISANEYREIPWAYPTYSSDIKYMLA